MHYLLILGLLSGLCYFENLRGGPLNQYQKHAPDILREHSCPPVITINGKNPSLHKIPHRLFQTWKTHELPNTFSIWSQTWKTYNPDWQFELWDDKDNRLFIQKYYPWFLSRYDAYPKEIYRADAVRYFYLYRYGGIYADLDFECCKSFESLLNEKSVILGRMTLNNNEHSIPNAIMASPPRAEFWLVVIYQMMQAPEGQRPEYTTGPVILRKAVLAYQNPKKRNSILKKMNPYFNDAISVPVQLRPPCELYPFDWTTSEYKPYKCTYAVTWWSHSWE